MKNMFRFTLLIIILLTAPFVFSVWSNVKSAVLWGSGHTQDSISSQYVGSLPQLLEVELRDSVSKNGRIGAGAIVKFQDGRNITVFDEEVVLYGKFTSKKGLMIHGKDTAISRNYIIVTADEIKGYKYFAINDSLMVGIGVYYPKQISNFDDGLTILVGYYSIERQQISFRKTCVRDFEMCFCPKIASIEFANVEKTLLLIGYITNNCYKYKLCDMTKNDTICNFQDVESGVQHRRSTRTDMYQGTYLNTDFINSFIDSSRQEILVGEKSSGVIYLSFPDRRHFNGLKNPFILEADDDGLSNRFRKYFLHSDDMISCIKIDTSHSKRTLTISTFEYTDNQFIHRNTKVVIDEEAPTDIGSIELIGDRILISYGSINYEAVDIHYKLVEIKPNAEIEINTLQTSLQEKFFIKPYIFSH